MVCFNLKTLLIGQQNSKASKIETEVQALRSSPITIDSSMFTHIVQHLRAILPLLSFQGFLKIDWKNIIKQNYLRQWKIGKRKIRKVDLSAVLLSWLDQDTNIYKECAQHSRLKDEHKRSGFSAIDNQTPLSYSARWIFSFSKRLAGIPVTKNDDRLCSI